MKVSKYDEELRVRLTKGQKNQIKSYANRFGMDTSTLVRFVFNTILPAIWHKEMGAYIRQHIAEALISALKKHYTAYIDHIVDHNLDKGNPFINSGDAYDYVDLMGDFIMELLEKEEVTQIFTFEPILLKKGRVE